MFENGLYWFTLIGTSGFLQLFIFSKSKSFIRITGYISAILALTSLFFWNVNVSALIPLSVLLSIGLAVSGFRMVVLRSDKAQLLKLTGLDSQVILWLASAEFIVLLVDYKYFENNELLLQIILSLALLASIISFIRVYKALKKYSFIQKLGGSQPSVSLLIPARNEDHALNDALRQATKSDYPKLELIVLDDCSQDSTAEIIRSFAHDGVRFIQGEVPKGDWLGKNHAYSRLSTEASGDILMFCGVDVQLEANAVSKLVSYMETEELDMVSVMPQRQHIDAASTLLQPIRYLWQMISATPSSPPVLSTCWLIRKDKLKKLGGFDGLRKAVIPEEILARELNKDNRYHFLISNQNLGVNTRKRVESQIDTAVRTHYPGFNRRISFSLLGVLTLLWLVVLPFLTLIGDNYPSFAAMLASLVVIVLTIMQVLLMKAIRPSSWWLGVVQLPIASLIEMYVIIESIRRYEFGSVTWKGRDICIPIYNR